MGKATKQQGEEMINDYISIKKVCFFTNDRRIGHVLVVETRFEVGEWGSATSGVGHDLESLVYQLFIVEFFEDPPDGLHEGEIEGLVVVLEVDPTTQASDHVLPFARVLHDYGATLSIVGRDAHLQNIFSGLDSEFFVDLKLDGKSVSVPTKSSSDVMASLMSVTRDRILISRLRSSSVETCFEKRTYLDGSSKDVAVVRQTGGEGRTIVEGILRTSLGKLLYVGGLVNKQTNKQAKINKNKP